MASFAPSTPQFTETQLRIFRDRYALREAENPDNILEDNPKQMWQRVADWAASAEDDEHKWRSAFYEVLEDFRFIPGGRILHGAGSGAKVTGHNCFVLPSPEDSRQGIIKSLGDWIETQARGGGVGINMSSLRPSGAVVKGVHGTSSGPIPWMQLFTTATSETVQQGGSRRGAAMIMLADHHPDVMEFITAKREAGKLEGANLSVTISDSFMGTLEEDGVWNLHWGGEVWKTIKARDLWDMIIESAHNSGEPGIFWMDRANAQRNLWYLPESAFICTNPCAEIPLPAYGACLASGTQIDTPFGVKEIQNLPNRFSLRTVTSFGDVVEVHDCALIDKGVQEVFEMELWSGQKIRATADHLIATDEGWVKLRDLEAGSRVRIQSDPSVMYADKASPEDEMLGWFLGDGWLTSETTSGILFSDQDEEAFHSLKPVWDRFVGREYAVQVQPTGVRQIGCEKRSAVKRFLDRGFSVGTALTKRLPSYIREAEPNRQAAFLRGLFGADGTVRKSGGGKRTKISLSSSSRQLLEDVQIVLSRLGIQSRIGWHELSDTRRNPQGALDVTGDSAVRFISRIGFSLRRKEDSFERPTKLTGNRMWSAVRSITFMGMKQVWDITMPREHSFFAQGMLVHNCNLGTINVAQFIHDQEVQWDDLRHTVRVATRFLDNVIDLSYYPLPQYQKHQWDIRQEGLGLTGLADALIKMKFPYGSEESLELTERFYEENVEWSWRESTHLAEERGMFPLCQPEKHVQSEMAKKLPNDIRERILRHGIRNAYLTAQQPSGTQSLLAGVNSGLEPVFDYNAIRHDRTGTYTPTSQATEQALLEERILGELPNYFVSSSDLTPQQHVDVQARAQKWIDQSISKTVNAPADYKPEQTREVYEYAWKQGLKTIAFYRDGSRAEQVLHHAESTTSGGSVQLQELIDLSGGHEHPERKKLPAHRPSKTHRFQVGELEGYITMGFYPDTGKPGEVFIAVSKMGSAVRGLLDAYATLFSIALQYGVPVEKLATKFKGTAFEPSGFTDNPEIPMASSVIDYVARWCGMQVAASEMDKVVMSNGHLCPECGGVLIPADGCENCTKCGYSRCG